MSQGEIRALELPVEEDLRLFSAYLWQQNIPHRVVEESGQQVLLIGSSHHLTQVRSLYEAFRSGELQLREQRVERPVTVARGNQLAQQFPVSLTLIFLSLCGFALVMFDPRLELVRLFTFFPFDLQGRSVVFSMPVGEYWRLITPIFLHFGLLHVAFNSLWMWELGRRVEVVHGAWRLVGITLLIGTGSNIAQAMFAELGIFGGMSGVVYGLLGYIWAWNRLRPEPLFALPNAIMVMMLVWLVLCMVGFAELLGAGSVANAAHVGGLLMGLLLGGAGALLSQRR